MLPRDLPQQVRLQALGSGLARLVLHSPYHQHNRRCGELPLLESRLVGIGVDRERRSKRNWIFRSGLHSRLQRRQVRGKN